MTFLAACAAAAIFVTVNVSTIVTSFGTAYVVWSGVGAIVGLGVARWVKKGE